MKKNFYILLVILILLCAVLCGCNSNNTDKKKNIDFGTESIEIEYEDFNFEYRKIESFDIPFDIQDSITLLINSKEELEKASSIKDGRYPEDPNAYYTLENLDKYNDEYFETHSILMYSWRKWRASSRLQIQLECRGNTLCFINSMISINNPSMIEASKIVNEYKIDFLELSKKETIIVKNIERVDQRGVMLC